MSVLCCEEDEWNECSVLWGRCGAVEWYECCMLWVRWVTWMGFVVRAHEADNRWWVIRQAMSKIMHLHKTWAAFRDDCVKIWVLGNTCGIFYEYLNLLTHTCVSRSFEYFFIDNTVFLPAVYGLRGPSPCPCFKPSKTSHSITFFYVVRDPAKGNKKTVIKK